MLIGCMRYWPVRAEKTELDVAVGKGDAREESSLSGVRVPVVGMVAPSVTDDDHLASNRRWVRRKGFDDGRLENKSARREELADGVGYCESLSFGLSCVLETEVVYLRGCKDEGNIRDSFPEGATNVEGASLEVCGLAT